jgi:hypothetical protein
LPLGCGFVLSDDVGWLCMLAPCMLLAFLFWDDLQKTRSFMNWCGAKKQNRLIGIGIASNHKQYLVRMSG